MTVDRMRARLRALLPPWFADDAPILDGLLSGIAALLVFVEGFIAFARLQTRVATSTGGFLDLTAYDFFRTRIRRRRDEPDPDFATRIRNEVLRPRSTRASIVQAVSDLTGFVPTIIEPWNAGDCGCYDVGTLAYEGTSGPAPQIAGMDTGAGGYDVGGLAYIEPSPFIPGSPGAGIWADPDLRNRIYIQVRRADIVVEGLEGVGAYDFTIAYGGGAPGIPALAGYDTAPGGYEAGPFAYEIPDYRPGEFPGTGSYGPDPEFDKTDADIFATIAATVSAGVFAYTNIDNA